MKDKSFSDLRLKRAEMSSHKWGPKPSHMKTALGRHEEHWTCCSPASPLTSREGRGWFRQLCSVEGHYGVQTCQPHASEQCFTVTLDKTCFLLYLTPTPQVGFLYAFFFLVVVRKLYLKATGSFYLGSWGLSTQQANNDLRDKDAT